MYRKIYLTTLFIIFLTTSVKAQSPLEEITPDNIADLQQVGALGRGTLGEVTWSSDSTQFAAYQNGMNVIYDVNDISEPVRSTSDSDIFEAEAPVEFIDDDGHYSFHNNVTNTTIALEPMEVIPIPDYAPIEERFVTSAVFSHDYSLMAMTTYEGFVGLALRLWDVTTGEELAVYNDQNTYQLYSLIFNPDDTELAIATPERIWRWDISNRRLENLQITAGGRFGTWLRYTADGTLLALFRGDGCFSIFEAAVEEELQRVCHERIRRDRPLLVDENWTRAAVVSGNVIFLWDLEANVELTPIENPYQVYTAGHTGGLAYELAMSPDGAYLVTAGDGYLILWDVNSGQLISMLEGFRVANMAAFSPDNTMLATLDSYKLTLWDMTTQQEIITLEDGGNIPHAVAFSPDGQTVATAYGQGNLWLWDVTTFEHSTVSENGGHFGDVVFSADGQYLAYTFASTSGHIDQMGVSVRRVDGLEMESYASWRLSWANQVVFSPDGSSVAATGLDGIHIYNIETQQEERILSARHVGERGFSIASSPDGRWLAAVISPDESTRSRPRLYIWEWESLSLQYAQDCTLADIDFSPNSLMLLACGQLIDLHTWQAVDTEIALRAFSPDGTLIVNHDLRLYGVPVGE